MRHLQADAFGFTLLWCLHCWIPRRGLCPVFRFHESASSLLLAFNRCTRRSIDICGLCGIYLVSPPPKPSLSKFFQPPQNQHLPIHVLRRLQPPRLRLLPPHHWPPPPHHLRRQHRRPLNRAFYLCLQPRLRPRPLHWHPPNRSLVPLQHRRLHLLRPLQHLLLQLLRPQRLCRPWRRPRLVPLWSRQNQSHNANEYC